MNPKKPSTPGPTGEAPAPRPLWRAESRVGTLVRGRYRLDALVGRGGSGATFRAHDLELDRQVALKLMIPRDGDAADGLRFIQEARIASRLRHPHIVEIFDIGIDDELPFLVMELLEGQTLQQALRAGGPMPPERTLEIIFPLLGAVAFAHDQKVLHRDLKPDNIFLAVDASGRVTPQLLDFGVAKVSDGATLTRSGTVVGTPAYMSPEQALDEALTPASDVWSLGVVLHVMLSDTLPFEGDGLTSVLLKVVNTPARPLLDRAPTLPKLLAHAVDQALRRDPSARPRDARRLARTLLAAALSESLHVPQSPEPVGLPEFEAWRRELAVAATTLQTPQVVRASELRAEAPRAEAVQPAAATPDAQPVRAGAGSDQRTRIALIAIVIALVLLGAWLGLSGTNRAAPEPSSPSAAPQPSSAKPAAPAPPAIEAAPSANTPPSPPSTVAPAAAEPTPSAAPALTPVPEAAPGRLEEPSKDSAPKKRKSKAPKPASSTPQRPADSDDVEFEDSWR